MGVIKSIAKGSNDPESNDDRGGKYKTDVRGEEVGISQGRESVLKGSAGNARDGDCHVNSHNENRQSGQGKRLLQRAIKGPDQEKGSQRTRSKTIPFRSVRYLGHLNRLPSQ